MDNANLVPSSYITIGCTCSHMDCFIQLLIRLAILFGFWASVSNAGAQESIPNDRRVCPVEKMPELRSGGGMEGIKTAVEQRITWPNRLKREQKQGRIFVSFTVASSGLVENVKILKGFRPKYDTAVVRAVRRLPRLIPSGDAGKPVAVSFTLPIVVSSRNRSTR